MLLGLERPKLRPFSSFTLSVKSDDRKDNDFLAYLALFVANFQSSQVDMTVTQLLLLIVSRDFASQDLYFMQQENRRRNVSRKLSSNVVWLLLLFCSLIHSFEMSKNGKLFPRFCRTKIEAIFYQVYIPLTILVFLLYQQQTRENANTALPAFWESCLEFKFTRILSNIQHQNSFEKWIS